MKTDFFKDQGSISTEQAILKLMQTPKGQEEIFYSYYDSDVINAFQRFLNSEEWGSVRKLLSRYTPPSMNALDLGSGNGIGTYALAKSGYSVVSLEPDPSELVGYGALRKVLKLEDLPILSVNSYGESLPFKDEIFGLVYIRQVLHHSKDLKRIMREIYRVLSQGGIFIATREHLVDSNVSKEIFLKNHPLHKYTKAEGAYLKNEYLSALKDAGFKLEKLILCWDSVINHYPISNAMVNQYFKNFIKKKLGIISCLFPGNQKFEDLYRWIKSNCDRTPGRLISFVAIKRN